MQVGERWNGVRQQRTRFYTVGNRVSIEGTLKQLMNKVQGKRNCARELVMMMTKGEDVLEEITTQTVPPLSPG